MPFYELALPFLWIPLGECARTVNPSVRQLHAPDLVGSEIGSTICFGFHEKCLYDFAKHTSFEVEEIDWTSFYQWNRSALNAFRVKRPWGKGRE
jgi:hypothetical protein